MASTNFLVFDEGKQNMMSDGDYSANTQRARGVTPGIAYPNLHNKLYYQVSVMAKAIADFMVAQGANASDEDVEQLTDDISNAFTNFVDNQTKEKYLPLAGGTLTGNLTVNGYMYATAPDISESNNKVPTAFWVKAYAPSKTGEGASGNWDIIANKAIADKNGLPIDTGYLKLTGGTVSGYVQVQAPSIEDNSNNVPTTLWVRTYAPSKTGSGASGNWGINITGNANTSTKTTQDSQGQQINTTYIKGITASNATLTITKGSGTTYSVTIDNVASSDSAKKVNLNNANREIIQAGSDKYENEAIIDNTANTVISSWNSIGFKTSADVSDKSIKLAIGTRTGNVETKGNIKAQSITAKGYMYTTSPDISSNDTIVPTTLWVRALLNSNFTASKQQNGWKKDGVTGIIFQWGTWTISSTSGGAKTNVTFPISFPNDCLFCIPSVNNSASEQIGYTDLTSNGCIIHKGAGDTFAERNGKYLVIGY